MKDDEKENDTKHDPPTFAEIKFNEDNYPILNANQPRDLCEVFEHPSAIRAMMLRRDILAGFAKEFHCAAVWHTFRERKLLADKYQRLAGNCIAILDADIN